MGSEQAPAWRPETVSKFMVSFLVSLTFKYQSTPSFSLC